MTIMSLFFLKKTGQYRTECHSTVSFVSIFVHNEIDNYSLNHFR